MMRHPKSRDQVVIDFDGAQPASESQLPIVGIPGLPGVIFRTSVAVGFHDHASENMVGGMSQLMIPVYGTIGPGFFSHRESHTSITITTDRWTSVFRPDRILVGYPVALVAVAGGLLAFPFSGILLGLFSVLVGAFLIVAIPFLLIVYMLMTIALSRALMALGRRLICGEPQRTSNLSHWQKALERQGTDTELWDRWIDGF